MVFLSLFVTFLRNSVTFTGIGPGIRKKAQERPEESPRNRKKVEESGGFAQNGEKVRIMAVLRKTAKVAIQA